MGGIGKTTLARRVYKDPSIIIHFDVHAWVVASQFHNKRQMLIGLLNSIFKQDKVESSNDEDLALKLYQSLLRQRYMVVIDDVWSGKAWDDVSKCFPDNRNGSRVLLTTREAKVASYTSSSIDFSHQMQFLNQSESWSLLCEKACRSRGAKFETIRLPIVEKCKGLPLAIIVVAGLFSKLNKPNEWENIAKDLLDSSTTTTIAVTCSKILSLSYNHLPHDLKTCFLYLGVFPEDYEINANELARLWSAEGLVKTSENENFDAVAKRHIQELMDRNLILVSKWSCGRNIKVFRVHDVLHAFCVEEAQKEKLLHVVGENGSKFFQKSSRWVSIQSSNFDASTLYYSSRGCRSILCFTRRIHLNLKNFKLLRVFFYIDSWLYTDIMDLVHLRYLHPAHEAYSISNVLRAWNLQTLYISTDLGMNVLEFPQLQYFSCTIFGGHPPKFVHQNLHSIIWLDPWHCTKELFTHVPNVKKIQICGGHGECNECIENLVYLPWLERLYINAYLECSRSDPQINNNVARLENLTRLKLQRNHFEWSGINVLCKLPRLKVLKLLAYACIGKEWELPEDDKFCQLIYLKIVSDDLRDWKATDDHFPKPEHLSLKG